MKILNKQNMYVCMLDSSRFILKRINNIPHNHVLLFIIQALYIYLSISCQMQHYNLFNNCGRLNEIFVFSSRTFVLNKCQNSFYEKIYVHMYVNLYDLLFFPIKILLKHLVRDFYTNFHTISFYLF